MQPVRAEAILRHTHYSFLGSFVAKGPLCLQAHPLIAMATRFYYTKPVNTARPERKDKDRKGKGENGITGSQWNFSGQWSSENSLRQDPLV